MGHPQSTRDVSQSRDIRRIVVVVPIHNEAELLGSCLSSLADASADVADAGVHVLTVLVLDSCTDASSITARRYESDAVRVLSVDYRNVGATRAAGFGCARTSGSDSWFVTTDADSRVGKSWLAGHLDHARRGARAVVGTVAVDFDDDFPPELRAAYRSGYRNEPGHRHIHGANLGVLERDYWAVGGFEPKAADEDVDLVRRLRAGGVPCVHAADVPVTTSGRLDGRAPRGFAGHLRGLAATP